MKQVRGTINAVELLGWLGADPELRFTPNGSKVCRFRLATKRLSRHDDDGKRGYETDWTPVETWEWLAERCNNVLHKGSRALVTGSLHTESWTDRESGETRYRTYVRADDVLFLDARPENGQTAPEEAQAAEAAEDEVAADIPF